MYLMARCSKQSSINLSWFAVCVSYQPGSQHKESIAIYMYLFLTPLAAGSSADVSNVSEVECSPLGMYKYVEASTSYFCMS